MFGVFAGGSGAAVGCALGDFSGGAVGTMPGSDAGSVVGCAPGFFGGLGATVGFPGFGVRTVEIRSSAFGAWLTDGDCVRDTAAEGLGETTAGSVGIGVGMVSMLGCVISFVSDAAVMHSAAHAAIPAAYRR